MFGGRLLSRLLGRRPAVPPLSHPRGLAAALVPAHNEAALIETTLRSILRSYHREDVFVFCDRCADETAAIARQLLPEENVFDNQQQMGKSRGVEHMVRNCIVPRGYKYVSVLDADTLIAPDYLLRILPVIERKNVVCVVGQVKSRWDSRHIITIYRTYVYALWQAIYKRAQSWINAVSIASGCASTWKLNALLQVDFDHGLSTEDFDLTMQAHRKRLGKIVYLSSAIVWTQEPYTVRQYYRQMMRWVRAWWEVVRKYRLGLYWLRRDDRGALRPSAIDIATALLTIEIISYIALLLGLLIDPIFLLHPIGAHLLIVSLGSRTSVLILMLWQCGAILLPALVAAIIARRPLVFLLAPLFLPLMYLDVVITLRAVSSTARSLYRRRPASASTVPASVWESPERRPEPPTTSAA